MNGNENSKTVWFLAAAVLVGGVAWFTRPVTVAKSDSAVLGTKLFPDFKDPRSVDNLRILRYDQSKGDSLALEVAKINGLWVIPSHGKYPADAKDHLASAANALIDLTILGLAPGFDPGSPPMDDAAVRKAYNSYEVVDPDPKTIKSTDEGIGTRVTMSGEGHPLADAIIGKAVPEQPEQYYVRIAGKEPVYIVKLDASTLSVHFEDWIEKNLLNLSSMDLKKVGIKDYTFTFAPMRENNQIVVAPVLNSKGDYSLDLASGDQPWKLTQAMTFDPAKEKMTPCPMAATEELNTANLDALKSALEDLKIVDVQRKPAAVPADLRVRNLDQDTVDTLEEKGFYVVPVSKDPKVPAEIFSNSGEITLQMADGARYLLRFGLTKGESYAAAKKKAGKAAKEDKSQDASSPGMDRWLFVTADFNQDAIPKPVFDKLPEEKPAEAAPPAKAGPKKDDAKEAKAAVKKDEVKKEEVKKGDDKAADAKRSEDKKAGDKMGDLKKDDPKKADAKKEEPKKDPVAKAGESKKDEVKKEEPKKDEAKKEEPKKDAATLAAERKQVETENKRRQDEYDSKVAAGKKHAKELTERFAQWYYVIPGDTYAKIHIDRKDIVKKKEPPKDAAGHDHDHDHDALPASPSATLEQLKKDAPPPAEKK